MGALASLLGEEGRKWNHLVHTLKEKWEKWISMVEVTVTKSQIYEQAVVLASPEYKVIEQNLEAFQQLYRYRILDDISDLYQLQDLLKIPSLGEVHRMKRQLEAYLRFLFGGVFDRRLAVEQVCPSCFQRSLVDTAKRNGDEIKKACSECGFEITDDFTEDTFSDALDRDLTYQPSSAISYSGGLGCTFNPNSDREHKNLLWNIVNTDNVLVSDFAKKHPDIMAQFKAAPGEADSFEVVKSGDYVFCRTYQFMRHVSFANYFSVVSGVFNGSEAAIVPITEFSRIYPEIYACFNNLKGDIDFFDVVWSGELGQVYCKVGSFIRGVSIDSYFCAVNGLFHQYDAPLRKQKLGLLIDPQNELRRAKEYGLKLCEKHGFTNKGSNRNQAVYNTVGKDIDRLKAIVDLREHHVSVPTFVETVFYLAVCRFDDTNLAEKIKNELGINIRLVNFIEDIRYDIKKDGAEPNDSPVKLSALEATAKNRAKQA